MQRPCQDLDCQSKSLATSRLGSIRIKTATCQCSGDGKPPCRFWDGKPRPACRSSGSNQVVICRCYVRGRAAKSRPTISATAPKKMQASRGSGYQPKTLANTNGATMVASDSIMNFGVSTLSLPHVIFSLGTAPEYEPKLVVESLIWQK